MAPYQKTNAYADHERRLRSIKVVGLGRLELPTSRLSSARSNQLSYKPVIRFLEIAKDRPLRRHLRLASILALRTRRMTARGSSMKKEKRRRRRPANGTRD